MTDWQPRYHSTPLDEPHPWRAAAYVERSEIPRAFACLLDDAHFRPVFVYLSIAIMTAVRLPSNR